MNKYEINKINCGELGIRTLGTLLAYTHFPGVPLQPLEQVSVKEGGKNTGSFFSIRIIFQRLP